MHPTALISWAHRDPDWDDATAARRREDVLRLAQQLRANGIDCDLDAYHPNEDWTRWGPGRVDSVDVVLIVVSKAWRHAWEGTGDLTKHAGAGAEASALKSLEARRGRDELQQRCRLVLLPQSDDADIPLQMHGLQRYRLPADAELLLRDLTGQPDVIAPRLGPVPVLPPAMGGEGDVGLQKSGDGVPLRDQLAALPTPQPQDGERVRWVQARTVIEAEAALLPTAPVAAARGYEPELVRWLELAEPATVIWRPEWSRTNTQSGGAVVVLHVLPHPARSFSRRLRGELRGRLVAALRSLALLAPEAGLDVDERDESTWASRPAQHGRYGQVLHGGFAGCRLAGNGQISVWFALAKDGMGSVLDETEVVRDLAAGLELAALLLEHPDLEPAGQRAVAVAVELDDTTLLTDGTLEDLGHRTSASMRFLRRDGVRVPAEEAVPVEALRGAGSQAVAASLTRLLIDAWRR